MSESKSNSSEIEEYDFIVLGGGGSGLSGAMYAGRLGLKSLVLGHASGSELPIGGVITTTDLVENYPGFKSLTGHELAKKLEDHARDYDEVTISSEKAEEVKKIKKGFSVKTKKRTYHGKTILVATGTKWKKLPESVKGSEEFENKGVHYCALCDGPLYKGKNVGIIGGSDSAAKDALALSQSANHVYIIYRGEEIHPEPINGERVKKKGNIEVINNTNVTEIKGDKTVNQVVLDNEYKGSKTLDLDAVFVAIGHVVLSDLAKDLGVKTNKKDEVKIDHATSETNVDGVFAAGDVTDKQFKQLITGVADACTAAHSAYEYITDNYVEV
ncbi:MAG: NAD(P)/FAD-dependent oxidoreductase [Candidatus Pacearchaeota archaeon]